MIKKVDGKNEKRCLLLKLFREAVEAYGERATSVDERILDALADTIIETTQQLIKRKPKMMARYKAKGIGVVWISGPGRTERE